MTVSDLGTILIYLAAIIIFIVAGWYILQQLELPAPVQKFVVIAGVAIGAALLIWLLVSLAGGGGIKIGHAISSVALS
jgi:hypothetical protein